MEYRLTTKEDYPELVDWWKFWRFPAPSIDMLPNNLNDGIIIRQNEINICAGFIYRTPSNICFIEFIVSNPAIKDRELRQEAINLLIEVISNLAKKMNFKIMFTFVKNDSLINKLKNNGFSIGSNSFEMVKML